VILLDENSDFIDLTECYEGLDSKTYQEKSKKRAVN